jgi:probable UDP-sugar transporter A5
MNGTAAAQPSFWVHDRRHLAQAQWASLAILFLAIVSLSNQSKLETSQHHGSHSINHAANEHTSSVALSRKCLAEQNRNITAATLESKVLNTEGNSGLTQYEGHIFVLISCCLSSLANIYNEKLLKEDKGIEESIYIQNSKLYLFGIMFSSLSLVLFYHHFLFDCGFYYGYSGRTALLILNVASLGLTVSLILKYRDNMFHILASQMTTVTVITVSWLVHDFEPTLNFFLLAPIILLAIYLYIVTSEKKEIELSDS